MDLNKPRLSCECLFFIQIRERNLLTCLFQDSPLIKRIFFWTNLLLLCLILKYWLLCFDKSWDTSNCIEMKRNHCSPPDIIALKFFWGKKGRTTECKTCYDWYFLQCAPPSFLFSSYYSIQVHPALTLCSGVPIIMVMTETDIRWVSLE